MIFYIFFAFNIVTVVLCATECNVDLTFPINPCEQNSTNYFDCLKNCAEELWPQIIEGFPKYNLPILDPFLYGDSKYVINRGEIYGELNVYNVTVAGARKTQFLTVKVYIRDDEYHFEVNVKVPSLIVDGDCNAIGSLGAIRMGGKGHFNLTLENVKASFYVIGHAEHDKLVLEHFRIIPIVEKLKFHLYDFFEGNKEFSCDQDCTMNAPKHLSIFILMECRKNKDRMMFQSIQKIFPTAALIYDLLETFVNEFWPSLYRMFIPVLLDVWDSEFTNLFNHLLSQITISQIFP